MSTEVAMRRFCAERVAVLGTTDASGSPHLVPVTFGVVDDWIVFAVDHKPKTTTRLRRLENIALHPRVTFLADEYSEDWEELWWVRIDADAEILTEGEDHRTALDALAAKYHQYREFRPHGPVVRARIRSATGWTLAEVESPPAPEPDDKDWTWVLERPCPECGFDAAALDRDTIATRLVDSVPAWRTVLDRADVGVRPAPTTWSSLEYGCHVRDVHVIFAERGRLIQQRDDPQFANWDQDETALAKRYWTSDPRAVAGEIEASAAVAASVFSGLTDEQWSRVGRRSNGSVFTMDTLGRYYLHDVEHHLHDVRAG